RPPAAKGSAELAGSADRNKFTGGSVVHLPDRKRVGGRSGPPATAATVQDASMITVQHLTKYFGPVMAIDNVTFQVDRGEIVGFLGPNGAGKTTTMRILTSYLPATSGIAKVAGYDVMTESMDVRRHIGYLPESVPLYPEMRVEEYLTFRAKL